MPYDDDEDANIDEIEPDDEEEYDDNDELINFFSSCANVISLIVFDDRCKLRNESAKFPQLPSKCCIWFLEIKKEEKKNIMYQADKVLKYQNREKNLYEYSRILLINRKKK